MIDIDGKKVLDVTCGSRTIWFNKHHPAAIYCDRRNEVHHNIWTSVNGKSERSCIIDPDVQCDFTDLPFPDNQFSLVVFDPPHLIRAKETAWLVKNTVCLTNTGRRCCMMVSLSACACSSRMAC